MLRRLLPALSVLILLPLGLIPGAAPSAGSAPAQSAAVAPSPPKAEGCDEPARDLVRLQSTGPLVGLGRCSGVRPGGIVQTDVGLCTLNFVFGGSDGRRYIGTAGHCIIDSSAVSVGGRDGVERSWAPGAGPVARGDDGKPFGRFAYAVLNDTKDFALIRVDDESRLRAQMCHFGGPTGINSARSSGPVVLKHSGHGVAIGQAVPGRTALAANTLDPNFVDAYGAAISGDSGSGVISENGAAIGVLVAISPWPFGPIVITRIPPQIARANQVLGIDLTIIRAPLS